MHPPGKLLKDAVRKRGSHDYIQSYRFFRAGPILVTTLRNEGASILCP